MRWPCGWKWWLVVGEGRWGWKREMEETRITMKDLWQALGARHCFISLLSTKSAPLKCSSDLLSDLDPTPPTFADRCSLPSPLTVWFSHTWNSLFTIYSSSLHAIFCVHLKKKICTFSLPRLFIILLSENHKGSSSMAIQALPPPAPEAGKAPEVDRVNALAVWDMLVTFHCGICFIAADLKNGRHDGMKGWWWRIRYSWRYAGDCEEKKKKKEPVCCWIEGFRWKDMARTPPSGRLMNNCSNRLQQCQSEKGKQHLLLQLIGMS